MRFARPTPRQRRESIVPMINVVFLLLIFFLMTAQIAPPEPFEVTPPTVSADPAEADPDTLFVSAEGALAYGAARDEAVFAALSARGAARPLTIRADGALSAAALAAILPRLRAAGVAEVLIVTGAP